MLEKSQKRALRRHHRQRMIERGRKIYYIRNHWLLNWGNRHDEKALMYGITYHDHLATCSCDMCGNQRHNRWSSGKAKLTLQEIKAIDDEKDQLK